MGSKLNTDTVYLTETFTGKCDLAILIFFYTFTENAKVILIFWKIKKCIKCPLKESRSLHSNGIFRSDDRFSSYVAMPTWNSWTPLIGCAENPIQYMGISFFMFDVPNSIVIVANAGCSSIVSYSKKHFHYIGCNFGTPDPKWKFCAKVAMLPPIRCDAECTRTGI